MNEVGAGVPTRIEFEGSGGHPLAARLDLPAGPPVAFAVFAHCFTCSKDLRSAGRIASVLTGSGIGVLRFDFTGLGASGGEFASTNFSSNVDDLLAAADWLGRNHRAPALLIGHSLGGAASIVAGGLLPEVAAVASIAAPSDPAHLVELLGAAAATIDGVGEAEVCIAGRAFTIRRQFLDDLRGARVVEAAGSLRRPLLLLHSPVDEVVGVEHAATLFGAARHPKSFVSLDGADHLLSRPTDAEFAASVIGAWASRYLSDGRGFAPPPAPTAQVVVAETTQGRYLNHVVAGRHRWLADEPETVGGFDAGPAPYDLLAAALGACTSMTLRMYAERKQLPLARVTVEVAHDRVHADDAAGAVVSAGRAQAVDVFTRVIHLEGDLDAEQRESLLRIANRCPVHRTLEQSSRIETRLDV